MDSDGANEKYNALVAATVARLRDETGEDAFAYLVTLGAAWQLMYEMAGDLKAAKTKHRDELRRHLKVADATKA